jgi:hypothetical protein
MATDPGVVSEVILNGRPLLRKMAQPQSVSSPPPPPPPPPMATQSDLGDDKLYTLPEPTTVAANQTKQVRFLDQAKVSYRRIYTYRVGLPSPDGVLHLTPQPSSAQITLKLVNETDQGLGKPLPSGHVVAMAQGAGGQEMVVGADRIDDTPLGADLTLALGRSTLVAVEPHVISTSVAILSGRPRRRAALEVSALNAGADPALVEIRQTASPLFQVRSEDHRHDLQGGEPRWTVTVPPHGRVLLHYSLDMPG